VVISLREMRASRERDGYKHTYESAMNLPALFAPPSPAFATRRSFLRRAGNGFGMLALAGLLENEGLLAAADGLSQPDGAPGGVISRPRPSRLSGSS